MKNNIAKRLLVAAMLTTWVANPTTVLAVDTHQDITTSNSTITGAVGVESTYQGGAVTISGAVNNVVLSGTFDNNSTTNNGGAIAVLDGASVKIADGTIFSSNHATNGGAFLNQASNVIIGNNVTFENNYSDNYAGAFLNQRANLTIGDYVTFKNNISNKVGASGSHSGAALAIEDQGVSDSNTSVVIGDNALFESNQSGKSGAGIYIYESAGQINLKIGNNAKFINNTAVVNGGAMSVYGATGTNSSNSNKGVSIGQNAYFEGNTAGQSGGAIYATKWNGTGSDTTLNIGTNATYKGNSANVSGGAIYTACDTTINNATFTENKVVSATANGGGAIFVDADSSNVAIEINNSVFEKNIVKQTGTTDPWGNGGAIDLRKGDLTITGSTFTQNEAGLGGALIQRLNDNKLTISDSVFDGNTARAAGALAVYKEASIIGTDFTNNVATDDSDGGGAVFLGAESKATFKDVEFVGNTSGTRGGAISTRAAADANNEEASLTLENVLFDSNIATTTGGAIDNYLYTDSSIKNVTFKNNEAAQGGAIYNHGQPADKGGGTGVITIEAAQFIGNKANVGGGAIYNEADLVLDTTNGDILFADNGVGTGENFVANDIHTTDYISIKGDNNKVALDTITGTGDIEKTGANTLVLNGDNGDYTGTFSQTSGVVQAFKEFFGGSSTIEDSSLELKDGASIVASSDVTLNDGSNVLVEEGANVLIAGAVNAATGSDAQFVNKGNISLASGSTLTGNIIQDTVNSSITVEDGASFGTTQKIEGGKLTIESGATLTTDIEVTQAVMLDVGSSLTMDDEGISIGGAYIKGAELNLASADITIADGGAITTDLTLSGNSVITPENGNIVKIGDGISANTLTLSNEFSTDTNHQYEIAENATLKITPNKGSYLNLNSDIISSANGTAGTVLIDEMITQIDNPNFDSSLPADPTTNPEKIDKHWGVGTVNIASDNSGFVGTFVQKMGDVILKAGSKFFGGNNTIESGTLTAESGSQIGGNSNTILGGTVNIKSGATLSGTTNTVEGGTLNLQDGAILASAVTATTNTTNNTYGTINLYNGIKGSIVDSENPDAVIIAANSIANGNDGLLTYVNNNNSSEQSINLNNGVGLGLFNGTTVQGDIALQSDKGVRDLALGNGSGLLSANPEDTLAISLGDNTSLSYFDGAVIQDNSTVEMSANSNLNFNNNTDTVDYNPVVSSSATTSSINKNGSSAVTINSSLAGFKGSVNTTGGSLALANTDTVNLNNINANNSVLTVAGDVNANSANFKGANSVINLKGASQFSNMTMSDATLNATNNLTVNNNLTITSTAGNTPTINLIGGNVNTITANSLNLNGNANIAFDANPRSSTTDSIIVNNNIINGNTSDPYKLLITGINFTDSPIDRNVNIDIANLLSDSTGSQSAMVALKDGGVVANSAMGRYLITSSGSANSLNASLMALNPQMYRGQVATIASWQNQLVVNNMLFDHMQVVTRQLMDEERTANKYAAAYPQFAPYQYSAKDGNLWYKAYGVFETLSMTKGLHVGNNGYGSLIGADFPLVNLKNGWKLVPTAYVGYNGGHQHFDGVSMYQNGAQLGMMGTAYKGDLLTSLLAYGGGYGNDMTVRGQYGNGSDNTGNWFAGVASKTAYNFHLTKDLIFQPTALISYNAFGSQNWGSNFGAMSMSTGMLNGINAAPGFNLIWQKKSFSLYATAQMVYNIMGGVDGQAGNIDTGYARMKHAYFEYGIGAMKQLKERCSGYLQITIRNGGRTGIGFQGGLNWKVGRK